MQIFGLSKSRWTISLQEIKGEMLSLPALFQRWSRACSVVDTFLLCHCSEPLHPPHFCSTRNQEAGADKHAQIHTQASMYSTNIYVRVDNMFWWHALSLQWQHQLTADRAGSLFVYFTAQIRGFNFLGKAKVKENLPDNCVNTWTKQAARIDGKIDLTQSSWISVWLLWIQQPLFQGRVPFSLKLLKTIFCPYSLDYLLNLTGALS